MKGRNFTLTIPHIATLGVCLLIKREKENNLLLTLQAQHLLILYQISKHWTGLVDQTRLDQAFPKINRRLERRCMGACRGFEYLLSLYFPPLFFAFLIILFSSKAGEKEKKRGGKGREKRKRKDKKRPRKDQEKKSAAPPENA